VPTFANIGRKEPKVITLPKPGEDSKFTKNVRSISFLSTVGKLLEKLILIIKKHAEERNFLIAGQFGFATYEQYETSVCEAGE
jgi:hypothetical protein